MRPTFKDLPKEIQEKALQKTREYGKDPQDLYENLLAGFIFDETPEGYQFWYDIMCDGKFEHFYKKYPKTDDDLYGYPEINNRSVVFSMVKDREENKLYFGHAVCNPNDVFNPDLGKKIAKGRALKESSRILAVSEIDQKYMDQKEVMKFVLDISMKRIEEDPEAFIPALGRF